MTSNELLKVIRAEPFRPFRLHMGGGRSVEVPHREFISVSPTGRIAVVYDIHDAAEIIDVFMIQSIELFKPRATQVRKRRKAG